MSKRKMVQSNLVKNSISAYFASIEIHNKPNISYRYETATLLMMNAWELILKAYIKKSIKKKSIYTKDGHTISLDKAISYVEEHINSFENNAFCSIKENLLLMEEYRNNIVHYYNEQLEPYIFMLTAKAALNYVDFVKKFFSKDIMQDEGLFILPLGFKLPFKPEDFLSRNVTKYISSEETKKFINSMIRVITDLEQKGIEDTIVLGFDIYLENVKKMSNSDLLVAITSKEEADARFSRITKYRLTNDTNAQKITLSDDELKEKYPLTHKEVSDRCKSSIVNFKKGKKFYAIMNELKKNPQYAYVRLHNPNSIKSSQTTMYSCEIINEIEKLYVND